MLHLEVKFLDLKAINKRDELKFKDVFNNFLESGQYILGEDVSYFENKFAKYTGAKYCVGVGNGLEALKILMGVYGSHDKGNIPLKLTETEILNFDKNLPIT